MLDSEFFLNGKTAVHLYSTIAKDAPIYDYHSHLSAKDIYEDEIFEDISAVWLKHDHYKWRAMRYAGIPEEYITGNRDKLEKFKAWARTSERLIGCPLYHWTNMELRTYFGINEVLKESNSEEIFSRCNDKIKRDSLSPMKMITKSNVKLICTTDDPIDNLEFHIKLKERQNKDLKVLPTFRPDKVLNIQKLDFCSYIDKLSETGKSSIKTYEELIQILKERIHFFHEAGCIMADHSLETLSYAPTSKEVVEAIFQRRLEGQMISEAEAGKYRNYTLMILASQYKMLGWAMQLHIGAYRNINTKSFHKLGADTGFDIMNDYNIADPLIQILNDMEQNNSLPKTILYTLNAKDNLLLSSIPHCFTEEGIPGKIQFGPAWWFNDHKDGIKSHLQTIAAQGMLADFVGMLTDSRSFLSYERHDYFRRILCGYIGELVDKGEFEQDEELLQRLVEDICCKNIQKYLGLEY
ncbi:MAG TPA: glucuronate isomerase [Mobilitalea sp.]|nr:glucuronate isomerase [Mobilitalea sp.]